MAATKNAAGVRARRAAEAARLRGLGWTYKQIAAEMGISHVYASSLVNDPDGSRERERRLSYAGTCLDCGKPTSGSNGRAKAPKRCHVCSRKLMREQPAPNKKWTRERILEAIRWWTAEYGGGSDPPGINDFNPTALEDNVMAIRRYKRAYQLVRVERRVPWFATVIREFGSWNEAIAEAGFTPRVAHGSRENSMRRWRG